MFSHHILKPERTPIEANPWGTAKSSGAFCNLFRSRLLRAIEYREAPTEINGRAARARVCSEPFTGKATRALAPAGPAGASRNLSVLRRQRDNRTCPPRAWTWSSPTRRSSTTCITPNWPISSSPGRGWIQQRAGNDSRQRARRRKSKTQTPKRFAAKLQAVFRECHRVLKDDGLAGVHVTTTPATKDGSRWPRRSSARDSPSSTRTRSRPRCRSQPRSRRPRNRSSSTSSWFAGSKALVVPVPLPPSRNRSRRARAKLLRLATGGFSLSRNDRKIVFFGQLLTAISAPRTCRPSPILYRSNWTVLPNHALAVAKRSTSDCCSKRSNRPETQGWRGAS